MSDSGKKVRAAGRSWLRMAVYPVARPAADIKRSIGGIRDSFADAARRREQRVSDARSVDAFLQGKSAREKFEEIYRINRWSEAELLEQSLAARNTRLACLALIVVLFPFLLWIVATAPLWVGLLSGLVAVFLFAACAMQAARFAWWEAQIQERACFPIREFFARKDLFARVVRL